MISDFLIVGICGFAGSVARYVIFLCLSNRHFPWATLMVNVLGCFFIGIMSTLIERATPSHRYLWLSVSVGFLGAFTTFSAFGNETFTLLRHQQIALAWLNIIANLIAGIGSVWLGRVFLTAFC